MLLPKQNFEHWLVYRSMFFEDETIVAKYGAMKKSGKEQPAYLLAGTQRLPSHENDFVTVFIPYIDGFTTIHASEIVFTIRNIKPK